MPHDKADFVRDPVRFIELNHEWAAGGPAPDAQHAEWLTQLPVPRLADLHSARAAFWGILSYPHRGRSLVWLDSVGLLQEILPCWAGNSERRAFRLRCVEQVHLEPWSAALNSAVYDWLSVYLDQRVDGRLGGWALCGLATLLLEGDESAEQFAARVSNDLHSLGANAGEVERVAAAVRDYPVLLTSLQKGLIPSRNFSPTVIVATISTIAVHPGFSSDDRARAYRAANELLSRFSAPTTASGRRLS